MKGYSVTQGVGGQWERLEGDRMVYVLSRCRVGVALGAVLSLLAVVLFCFAGPALAFSDVPAGGPYAAAIDDLSGRQIINGYNDGTFGPDNPTMRQQFAKMIVLSLGLPVSETDVCTFVDVDSSGPDSLYPDNYIAVAAAKGITAGTTPSHFSPDLRITRAQAVTMVVRALDQLEPGALSPTPAGFQSTWGDFSPDHAGSAAKAESNGLLAGLGADASHPEGDLSALDPFGEMPRGEVAQLLHNLVVKAAPPPPPPPVDYAAIHAPDAALSATYATCAASSCHDLNLFSQHVVKLALSCDTCHASTRPEVVGAIAAYGQTGAKQGCRVCHGQGAGQHMPPHELINPAPTACTLCHSPNLVSEHVTTHQLTCAVCHGAAATPAVAAVVASFVGANPMNPVCTDCHASSHEGLALAHTATEADECKLCHQVVLADEHARSSSSGASKGCAVCHPLKAGFSWSGLCADCHKGGGVAAIRHQAIDSAHTPVSTCASGGCHPSDLRVVHQSAPKGCQTCHGTTSVPATSQCTVCHASAHPGLAAAHTEGEQAECKDCHLMVLPDEHARSSSIGAAKGCAVCHPLKAGFSSSGLCADCHKGGGAAPVRHQAIDAAHNSASTCANGGCHPSDLRVVHQSAPNGCKTCHGTTSVPATSQCTVCHASAHPGLAAAHTYDEQAECKDCHLMILPDEHTRSSSSSVAAGCQNCHPLPGGFVSTKVCADCHKGGGVAPVRHQAIDSAHAVSVACTGSSCHSSDLRTLHQGTAAGCKTCHGTSSVPTTKECSSCHPSTPHVVREPYRASCSNCHPIGGPGKKLHDWHVGKGYACGECHGVSAPGCANGSCHKHSVDKIHGVDDHPSECTYCHKSGTPSGTP
jgi:hypothetical protein